jgi:Asp-tRNA(Asn)/Glu-tRNA(Gln) amidotransferase B subunit
MMDEQSAIAAIVAGSPEWAAFMTQRRKTINYLVGQVLKRLPLADPRIVRERVITRLDGV